MDYQCEQSPQLIKPIKRRINYRTQTDLSEKVKNSWRNHEEPVTGATKVNVTSSDYDLPYLPISSFSRHQFADLPHAQEAKEPTELLIEGAREETSPRASYLREDFDLLKNTVFESPVNLSSWQSYDKESADLPRVPETKDISRGEKEEHKSVLELLQNIERRGITVKSINLTNESVDTSTAAKPKSIVKDRSRWPIYEKKKSRTPTKIPLPSPLYKQYGPVVDLPFDSLLQYCEKQLNILLEDKSANDEDKKYIQDVVDLIQYSKMHSVNLPRKKILEIIEFSEVQDRLRTQRAAEASIKLHKQHSYVRGQNLNEDG